MKTLAAILMALFASAAAGAQVNKCFDANGKVVAYAAECPSGTRAEQTNIKNAPAAAETAQKSLSERDADFRKRQMERQEADAKSEKKSAEVAQRKRACEDAQAYLKNLQTGQRIRTTDAKSGERGYLADSDYPKEIARAQKSASEYCK